ncbi:MAG: hypothetical protein KDC53_00610, partial [Saprospiraceae bacterium]|nr:hypothetical protein [Saprospiraceae bacterium]
MKKYLFHTILSLILLFNVSCQKDIEFGKVNSNYDQQLFIEGILYPGENPKIYISIGVPFFNKKVNPQEIFARNLQVEITGPNYTETLQADSIFDKFRCRWTPFYAGAKLIEYNAEYQLKVREGNNIYTATTTISQSQVNLNTVEYSANFYDVYGGHDGVILTVKDPEKEINFYRFQMNRMIDNTRKHAHILDVIDTHCTTDGELYPVTDLGRTVFSDGVLNGKTMQMNIEVAFEYEQGDSATIYLQSLDKDSTSIFICIVFPLSTPSLNTVQMNI